MIIRSLAHALSPGGGRGRLSILIFHRVLAVPDPLFPNEMDARRFQQLLGWVQRGYRVMPLDDAVRQLVAGTLPPRALCLSFDDGYADNASVALPLLRHFGFPATFFIASGYLDGGCMWNDSVIEAIRRTPHRHLDMHWGQQPGRSRFALRTLAERRLAIESLLARLKYLPPALRQQAVDRLVDAAEVPLPQDLMLRSEQLRLLRDAGMQIGAHTVSHPILERSSDVQARWEIGHSKRVLQDVLDEPVTLFAYPNGIPGTDYSARHVAMVRDAGFAAAVSTACGAAAPHGDMLQLPRFTPWDRTRLRFGARMLQNVWRRTQVA